MVYHVILSGGLDSTAALARAVDTAEDVAALSFDYGQRHRRELDQAVMIAGHYGVPHKIVQVGNLVPNRSALLDGSPVPEGSYDDASMSATVVSGRNLLFAAAAVAQADSGDVIVTGVHAGDHPIYADCRPDFWQAVEVAAQAYGVQVATPYIDWVKHEIVSDGAEHDAPLHLTWSCYRGEAVHCGRCGTCVERAEAFDLACVADPTEYADPDFWRSAVQV